MEHKQTAAITNLQWSIAICIILISCIFLFPPEYLLAKQISRYALLWMFLCLILGIGFMFLDWEKLLFISFTCAGLIASFLLYSYNSAINFANNSTQESLSMVFVNPSLSTDDFDNTYKVIVEQNPDVLIIEEVTPEWRWLMVELKEKFENYVELNRVDPFGKAIFSKYKFNRIDTVDADNNPILSVRINLSEQKEILISVANFLPAVTKTDLRKLNSRLLELSTIINSLEVPHILSANLNLVPWDRQIREFKVNTKMSSSRRDQIDGSSNTQIWNILNVPMNEIYYSENLECSGFKEINDTKNNSIGLFGRYQFKIKNQKM
ncbi:MAG: endonuclease/exonuclease/phosphatase family protein [Saprospiraceae bacterium]|nr:endonuclease/exonuclease/phosphatase family protein [Saprospiraceae bacterium]